MRTARILTAAFLVCSVLLSAIGMGAGRVARAATASLALTPSAILQGADRSVLLSGRDFTPDSQVTLRFDDGVLGAATTDGSGAFTATVSIPNAAVGAHTVRAIDAADVSAAQSLNLVSLTLSSSSAPAGSPVTISGAGFLPSQPFIVRLAGIAVLTGVTSASGTFANLSFVVPSGLSGQQVLSVHNGSPATIVVSTALTVGQASLLLHPDTVSARGAVHVSGAGYASNAALTIKLDDRALGVVTANAAGAFGPTAFALPADVANGRHIVSAQSSAGHVLARATLIVSVPAAALAVTPNTGVPGTQVLVTGSGFFAGEAVSIAINGAPLATAIATAQGQIRVYVVLPAHLPAGAATVQAVGQSSRQSAVVTIVVSSPARLSLSNGSVRAGDQVTISGVGFAAHEPVRLTVSDHVSTTVAADGRGAFAATVTIPVTARSANVQVIATGQHSQRAAQAALTIAAVPAGITISAGAVPTLGSFTVDGNGFHPGEQVAIGVSGHVLASVTANDRGAFTGVSVTLPASIVPGAVTVTAAGQSSQKTAGANLTVLARNGNLSIAPAAFAPGATVRLEGSGFAPREEVALAVHGSAPFATAVADHDGRFVAHHALPAHLAPGSIRITATGLASRAVGAVSAHILAPAPTPTPAPAPVSAGGTNWYFVGGRTDGGYREQIVVLNPNDRPVQGTITFNYGSNGTSVHRFDLRAQARGTYDVNQLVGNVGRVAGTVQTNLPVVAARTAVGGHGEMMPASAVTAPSRTWYMAEGYTGLTFREELDLFNPTDQPAQVRVTWPLFNGKPAVTDQVTLAPHTQRTIPVNARVDRASHATMVESDQPVVAGRTMLFGARQQGAFTTVGATGAGTTLYFAEGSTNNGFEQFLTILNPDGSRAAQVTASFFDRQGNALGSRSLTVEPLRRATIKVHEVTSNTAIATVVRSSGPIVAERAMYFGAPNGGSAGGTVVFGQATPALGWSFASGDTRFGNSQFELLFNPNRTAAAIEALYYTDDGQVVRKTFTLPAHARLNIDVTQAVPELPRGYHGVILRSTDGVTFVAEQAIYGQGMASGGALTGTPIAW